MKVVGVRDGAAGLPSRRTGEVPVPSPDQRTRRAGNPIVWTAKIAARQGQQVLRCAQDDNLFGSGVDMPATQVREVAAAQRLENVRYAIRDLAVLADEVAKKGHKILPLNIGDPLNFDFQTPGDNLLTPSPDYPLYSAVLAKLGVELNTYALNEDDGWQPDLIDVHKKIG